MYKFSILKTMHDNVLIFAPNNTKLVQFIATIFHISYHDQIHHSEHTNWMNSCHKTINTHIQYTVLSEHTRAEYADSTKQN